MAAGKMDPGVYHVAVLLEIKHPFLNDPSQFKHISLVDCTHKSRESQIYEIETAHRKEISSMGNDFILINGSEPDGQEERKRMSRESVGMEKIF